MTAEQPTRPEFNSFWEKLNLLPLSIFFWMIGITRQDDPYTYGRGNLWPSK